MKDDNTIIGTWLNAEITKEQLTSAAEQLWDETYGSLGNMRNGATYYLHLSHEGEAAVQLENNCSEQAIIDGEHVIIWAPIMSERVESPMSEEEFEDPESVEAYQASYDDRREETVTEWVEMMSAELSSVSEAEGEEENEDKTPSQNERIKANIAALDEGWNSESVELDLKSVNQALADAAIYELDPEARKPMNPAIIVNRETGKCTFGSSLNMKVSESVLEGWNGFGAGEIPTLEEVKNGAYDNYVQNTDTADLWSEKFEAVKEAHSERGEENEA